MSDLKRLARAVKSLIRDFNWESENVRLVLGPIPYGPGPWTIGGNPDGNVALAIAHAYERDSSAATAAINHREAFRQRLASDPALANTGRILAHYDAAREDAR